MDIAHTSAVPPVGSIVYIVIYRIPGISQKGSASQKWPPTHWHVKDCKPREYFSQSIGP